MWKWIIIIVVALVIVGAASQRSLAVVAKVTTAPLELVHSTVMSDGHVMVGATVSSTVTLKVQVPVWPATSVVVHTTWVVPTGKKLPLGGWQSIWTVEAQGPVTVGSG